MPYFVAYKGVFIKRGCLCVANNNEGVESQYKCFSNSITRTTVLVKLPVLHGNSHYGQEHWALVKLKQSDTTMSAKRSYRQHEKDYRNELSSIHWEIKCQRASTWKQPDQWLYSPVVKKLRWRATLIKKALRRPSLPPLPDEWRNPFDRPFSNAQAECVRKLVKRYRKK